jgi:hypothetical protein
MQPNGDTMNADREGATKPERVPPPGYKPSMIMTTKCIRCGQFVRAFGYYAFEDACDHHFANCPAKKEKR